MNCLNSFLFITILFSITTHNCIRSSTHGSNDNIDKIDIDALISFLYKNDFQKIEINQTMQDIATCHNDAQINNEIKETNYLSTTDTFCGKEMINSNTKNECQETEKIKCLVGIINSIRDNCDQLVINNILNNYEQYDEFYLLMLKILIKDEIHAIKACMQILYNAAHSNNLETQKSAEKIARIIVDNFDQKLKQIDKKFYLNLIDYNVYYMYAFDMYQYFMQFLNFGFIEKTILQKIEKMEIDNNTLDGLQRKLYKNSNMQQFALVDKKMRDKIVKIANFGKLYNVIYVNTNK